MLCHLPPPYEDELLLSVIARYCARTGATPWIVATSLFGANSTAITDIPGSLDAAAAATFPVWGMDAATIAERLTLFPFYARYLPRDRAAECLSALRSGNSRGVQTKIGITAAVVKPPAFLRFCSACRRRDLETLGETWWRRSHQLPGTIICVEHGQLLHDSPARYRPQARWEFSDATSITVNPAVPPIRLIDSKVMAVARRCNEILEREPANWPSSELPGVYREAVLARGYASGGAKIEVDRLDADFVEFWKGTPFEQAAGVRNGGIGTWLCMALRHGRHAFHPTRHALLQIFIESRPCRFKAELGLGRGNWKCPNPYANHSADFRITRVRTRLDENGLVGRIRCTCGFEFTFRSTEPEDPAMPVIHTRCSMGPTWFREARRLNAQGLNITQIAQQMGVEWAAAKSLLRSTKGMARATKPTAGDIKKWRAAWSQLLETVPRRSRKAARRLDSPLYRKLWKWDLDWLLDSSPCHRATRQGKSLLDWATRDREWSAALVATAIAIKSEIPPRRASKAAIVKASMLPRTVIIQLDRLPKCRASLERHQERTEDWRIRRAHDQATRMRVAGR